MNAHKFKVLVVFRDDQVRSRVVQNLRFRIKDGKDIHEMRSIEEAIEHLESNTEKYALIVFESRGSSRTLVRAMIELGGDASFVVCGNDEQVISEFKGSDVPIAFLPLDSAQDQITKTIKTFEFSGKLPLFHESETDYLEIRADLLPGLGPLETNAYMLILDGRYVPVFKRGDRVTHADIRQFIEKIPDQVFYLRRDECANLLQSRLKRLETALRELPLDSQKVETVISENFGIVHDVVTQIGFTPEAQKVAINSVMLTIKLLGASPKLKVILADLKSSDGGYIPSHSIYLGKVACALAHKVGWRSQSTYFKLTLAAFLHDISLKDDRLARIFDLDLYEKTGSGVPDEAREIRMHPARAAEYSRQFEEIPSEVEQIVAQHHERPDGSGFPRGLVARYFTPLSALFIIAQDLIGYANSSKEISFEEFFKEKELEYNVGIFRKLARALRTDSILT